ncbi:MAG: hypothetical protein ACOZIN_08285 [Myxococcota bacterium]
MSPADAANTEPPFADAGPTDAGEMVFDAGRPLGPPGANRCVDAPLLRAGDHVIDSVHQSTRAQRCFSDVSVAARYYRVLIPPKSGIGVSLTSDTSSSSLFAFSSCEEERQALLNATQCVPLHLPVRAYRRALLPNSGEVEREVVLVISRSIESPFELDLVAFPSGPQLSPTSSCAAAPQVPEGQLLDGPRVASPACGEAHLYSIEVPPRSYAITYGDLTLRTCCISSLVNETDAPVRTVLAASPPFAWVAQAMETNTRCESALPLPATVGQGRLDEPLASQHPCGWVGTNRHFLYWRLTLPPRTRTTVHGEVLAGDDGTGIDLRVFEGCGAPTCMVREFGVGRMTATAALDNISDDAREVIVAIGQYGVGISFNRGKVSATSVPL